MMVISSQFCRPVEFAWNLNVSDNFQSTIKIDIQVSFHFMVTNCSSIFQVIFHDIGQIHLSP